MGCGASDQRPNVTISHPPVRKVSISSEPALIVPQLSASLDNLCRVDDLSHSVRLCRHISTQRRVRIKTISQDTLGKRLSPTQAKVLFGGLKKLKHPNLVTPEEVYAEDSSRGAVYLVASEYVSGAELCPPSLEIPCWEPKRILSVMVQLFSAVAHVHTHFGPHGNLKPGNVLLQDDEHVKILDTGLFTSNGSARDQQCLAPELSLQEPSKRVPSTAGDVYALGALLHTFGLGTLPDSTTMGSSSDYHTMVVFNQLVLSMMHHNPQERPTMESLTGNSVVAGELAEYTQRYVDRNNKAPPSSVPLSQAELDAVFVRATPASVKELLYLPSSNKGDATANEEGVEWAFSTFDSSVTGLTTNVKRLPGRTGGNNSAFDLSSELNNKDKPAGYLMDFGDLAQSYTVGPTTYSPRPGGARLEAQFAFGQSMVSTGWTTVNSFNPPGGPTDQSEDVLKRRLDALVGCKPSSVSLTDELQRVANQSMPQELILDNMDLSSHLVDVPQELLALRMTLGTLRMHGCSLTKFPPQIATFHLLSNVDLSMNAFVQAPVELGALRSLTRLDLSNNNLKDLPESFSQLSKLHTILLEANQFTLFPAPLMKLPQLAYVHMSENLDMVQFPPLEVMHKAFTKTEVHLSNNPVLVLNCRDGGYDVAGLGLGEHKNNSPKAIPVVSAANQVTVRWNVIFPSMITPSLYLGSLRTASHPRILAMLGITHVISALSAAEHYTKPPMHIVHNHVSVADLPGSDISEYFQRACSIIDQAVSSNGKVLVHCFKGQSRSATLVLAYLMKHLNIYSATAAMEYLLQLHPDACPNQGFRDQLDAWGLRLKTA